MAAAFVIVFACAPPPKTVANLSSPTPSPSPTPTAPLQASSTPFHGGEVGVAYATVALAATGGVAPYAWTVSTGALPPGLMLGPDGSVSGNPTGAGSFSFTIQVADAGSSTASLPAVIGVAAPLSAGLIPGCAQYCRVELGCVSVCGGFGQQSGGVGPYSYNLTQGPLPAGTSLSGLSLSGTFGGLSGYLKFTVQVTDAMGARATISPTFWMYQRISLAGNTCTGRAGCKVTLAYTGGTPGPQPSAAPIGWVGSNSCGSVAPLPCPQPGFAVTYQPGLVMVVLTYQANYPATFGTLTVQITEGNLCASGVHCSSSAAVSVVG